MIHFEVPFMKGSSRTSLEQVDIIIQDTVVGSEVILDLAQEDQTLNLKYTLLYMMPITDALKKLG